MKMTPHLFEAFLKCPTKCHLRSVGETGSGNAFADWERAHNEAYRERASKRFQEGFPDAERPTAPLSMEKVTEVDWLRALRF